MSDQTIRSKIWVIFALVALVILAASYLTYPMLKAVFTGFFLIWAAFFYLKKVRTNKELVSDGVWWIPYFLVIGLGLLSITGDNYILLTTSDWIILVTASFLLCICAVLFFWEWPPWFDKNKNLLSKDRRVFIAYLFLVPGLALWLYAGTCLANIVLDTSKPVAHDCRVIDKAVLYHRNPSDTQYFVMIRPWEGRDHPYSMFFPKDEYEHIVRTMTIVRIWTKEGFFHHQWVTRTSIVSYF